MHRAARDPGRHAAPHTPSRPSARFGSGAGAAPVAPLPTRPRTPNRNDPRPQTRPSRQTRSHPPNEHARCAKVGVSQVRKSGCLLTAGATGRILRLVRKAAQGWWSSGMDQAAAGIRFSSAGSVRQVRSGQVRPGQVQPGSLAREAPPSFTAWVAVSKDSRGGPGGVGTELWKRPRTRSRHPANCRQRGSTKELAPRTRTRDRGWYRYPGCE